MDELYVNLQTHNRGEISRLFMDLLFLTSHTFRYKWDKYNYAITWRPSVFAVLATFYTRMPSGYFKLDCGFLLQPVQNKGMDCDELLN